MSRRLLQRDYTGFKSGSAAVVRMGEAGLCCPSGIVNDQHLTMADKGCQGPAHFTPLEMAQ